MSEAGQSSAERNRRVPLLDFTKIYEQRELDNQEEEEDEIDEEEFEEEDDVASQFNEFFVEGTPIVSDQSGSRIEELGRRKDDVIAILNETAAEGEDEEDESLPQEDDCTEMAEYELPRPGEAMSDNPIIKGEQLDLESY